VFRPCPGGAPDRLGEFELMMMAVTLLGFFFLTALVIAMGTSSTARYERERAEVASGHRHAGAEPVRATAAA
jgi:hypothetical protein